jgi:hypothetical protein
MMSRAGAMSWEMTGLWNFLSLAQDHQHRMQQALLLALMVNDV